MPFVTGCMSGVSLVSLAHQDTESSLCTLTMSPTCNFLLHLDLLVVSEQDPPPSCSHLERRGGAVNSRRAAAGMSTMSLHIVSNHGVLSSPRVLVNRRAPFVLSRGWTVPPQHELSCVTATSPRAAMSWVEKGRKTQNISAVSVKTKRGRPGLVTAQAEQQIHLVSGSTSLWLQHRCSSIDHQFCIMATKGQLTTRQILRML